MHCLRMLCNSGAKSSLSTANVRGECPLVVAIASGNTKLLCMILDEFDDPIDAACGICDEETGWTPLHVAAVNDKV